jgi:hypothetical protein
MKLKKMLKISGDGIDIEYVFLSEKEAEKILTGEMTSDDLDDLWSTSGATESGATSVMGYVDGKEVGFSCDISAFKPKNIFKIAGKDEKNKWVLVKKQLLNGDFAEFRITGKYSEAKIACAPSFFDLRGLCFGYLNISFDGDEGDVGVVNVKYEELYLLDPKGRAHDFDIADADENKNQLAEKAEYADQAKRIFSFRELKGFSKFKNWISEELKPSIDEGLADIYGIELDEGKLEVTIIGTELELRSLPSPTMDWCAKEFGKFKVKEA